MAASEQGTSDVRVLPRDYPPAEHVLRDLRLWSDSGAEPPYVGNSLGGLQGGIALALLDLAAEAAGCARLGSRVATRDLAVHFLAIGREGPLRTSARVLRVDGDALLLRVEARDAGAGDRLCTIATAVVTAC